MRTLCCFLAVILAPAPAMAASPGGETAFLVTLGNFRMSADDPPTAVTTVRLSKQDCALWSKSPEQPDYDPVRFYECRGSQPLPSGARVDWTCKAKDRHSFTHITIGGEAYELAKGRLFLLRVRDGEPEVLQIDPGESGIGVGAVRSLTRKDPRIGEFFADEP